MEKVTLAEARLRQLAKERGFYDPANRAARVQLREASQDWLLTSPPYAKVEKVEQSVWKLCFYRPIEQFRTRVTAAAAGGDEKKEALQKVKRAFLQFLEEAAAFYTSLATQLQETYGDTGFRAHDMPSRAALADAVVAAGQPPAWHTAAVGRCLICLGDLSRYAAASGADTSSKDMTTAEHHYRNAITVFPSGGNAFNQLAVLSLQAHDEAAAVHFYFRSLAVAQPFPMARENLIMLFEGTRQKADGLKASSKGVITVASTRGRGGGLKVLREGRRATRPIQQLLEELPVRFVHMHGLLFTRINLDTFEPACDAAMSDLADFLQRPSVHRMHLCKESARAPSLVMQLVIMALFSAWAGSGLATAADVLPGPVEGLQGQQLSMHALTQALHLTATLAATVARVAAASTESVAASPFLTPLRLLLAWFSSDPKLVRAATGFAPAKGSSTDAQKPDVVTELWTALSDLAATLSVCASDGAQEAAQGSKVPSECPALPEDWLLRAYLPLQASQASIDFTKNVQEDELIQVRVDRTLSHLHLAATHLGSIPVAQMSSGPGADQAQAAIQSFSTTMRELLSHQNGAQGMPAQLQAQRAAEDNPMSMAANGHGPVHQIPGVGTGNKAPAANGHADMAMMDEDDDNEEVIVFKPTGAKVALAKEQQPAAASPAHMDLDPAGPEQKETLQGQGLTPHIEKDSGIAKLAAPAADDRQQPQQQLPAPSNSKECPSMSYSLFGDQLGGGTSASWPSIPTSNSADDAAGRQKMSEREWKTSSGSASPMPTSVPPMGASSNTFGAVGQAAGHVHPQGLYGVPPLQTPGFTSGSSDVIEELLKEMANSHSGAMRPPSTANGQPSAKASKDMARVAGLPAPPHPSKLPTSSSIFDNMLNGGAGRTTAFGDLSASLPPYLGPNIGFPGTGDGLYGADIVGNGLGLRADAAPFSTSNYTPTFPEWNPSGGLQNGASSNMYAHGGNVYNPQQDQSMYRYGRDTLGDINGHLYQAGAQPWMTSSYMTPNGLQGDSTAPFPGSLANLLQPGQAFPSSSRFMT
ncbi:hypothetical protein WJX74_010942 [Apatococcus lobatus]|uniref:Uncharacterized protein n=1 Tax=Apatococcus lobatus TaxID=904363 RepID=A0AAW1QTW0_9CHLO